MDEAAKGQEEKQRQEEGVAGQGGEGEGEGSRPHTPDSDDSNDSFHTTSGEDPSTNMAGCGSCLLLLVDILIIIASFFIRDIYSSSFFA